MLAAQAMRIDSVALSLVTASIRNGRFTDMLPLIPGIVTFIREVAVAMASNVRPRYGCHGPPCRAALTIVAAPARTMNPMNAFVNRVYCIEVSSFLQVSEGLLFRVSIYSDGKRINVI